MAEQIQSHEVVRDHLIGCGDGFTNSYLTKSHVPCLHEVGSHPVVLFPYVLAHDHEARDKSLTAYRCLMYRCDLTSINGHTFRDPPREIIGRLLFLVIEVFREILCERRWSMYEI